MINLIRSFLGLCIHNYRLIDKHSVLKKADGTFTSMDQAGKYVTNVVYVLKCTTCSKLHHYNVHLAK